MSSRLLLDRHGRLVAEVTVPALGLEVGERFLVLGTEARAGERGFWFTGSQTVVRDLIGPWNDRGSLSGAPPALSTTIT